MTFAERIDQQIEVKGTPCIVGLDPDLELFPDDWRLGLTPNLDAAQRILDYNRFVIDEIHDLVPAVKPQSAFYERFGSRGIAALEGTVAHARERGLLVVLDAKRGDNGTTSQAYADAYVGSRDAPLACDAITLNPYLGDDSLVPYVRACQTHGTGVFVLAVTSNPGAARLQTSGPDGERVYQRVAAMVREMNPDDGARYGPVGVVAGATYPEQGAWLRAALPRSLFLVPGMGAQGGDPALLRSFFDAEGRGALASSSRGVTYPHRFGGEKGPREAAIAFVESTRRALTRGGS